MLQDVRLAHNLLGVHVSNKQLLYMIYWLNCVCLFGLEVKVLLLTIVAKFGDTRKCLTWSRISILSSCVPQ